MLITFTANASHFLALKKLFLHFIWVQVAKPIYFSQFLTLFYFTLCAICESAIHQLVDCNIASSQLPATPFSLPRGSEAIGHATHMAHSLRGTLISDNKECQTFINCHRSLTIGCME